MDKVLTKDCDKLICIIYKDYLEKRKSGMSKSKANHYSDSHFIHENLIPEWSFDDVNETCRELSRLELTSCSWYDNIAAIISISDDGIIYMENRFKNGFKEVTDFISKFIP